MNYLATACFVSFSGAFCGVGEWKFFVGEALIMKEKNRLNHSFVQGSSKKLRFTRNVTRIDLRNDTHMTGVTFSYLMLKSI